MATRIERGAQAESRLRLYRTMQIIRQCEEELARCHQRGLVHGACHTYVGQEAIAAGVCAHLKPDDVVFSTHRGHGHALAKGLEPGINVLYDTLAKSTNKLRLLSQSSSHPMGV